MPGTKYSTVFYSLFSCPKAGCDSAQDSISVRFKEGVDGVYREVYKIVGKGRDDRWSKNSFTYTATSSRLYVCKLLLTKYFIPLLQVIITTP